MFRQTALDRLSAPEELDELMHVTSPRSWLALIALSSLLVTALIWSVVATIPTTVSAAGAVTKSSGSAEAVVFTQPSKAQQLRAGMRVNLTIPTTAGLQAIMMTGTVTSVGVTVASQHMLLHMLGSTAYTRALEAGGQLIPVHVALSGRAASSLRNGMPCSAVITVDTQQVIRLLIP